LRTKLQKKGVEENVNKKPNLITLLCKGHSSLPKSWGVLH